MGVESGEGLLSLQVSLQHLILVNLSTLTVLEMRELAGEVCELERP